MKKLLIILISLLLITPIVPSASSDISVYIDGQIQTYSQPPIIQDDSTLVPLRGIFESLGAVVQWDGATETVTDC